MKYLLLLITLCLSTTTFGQELLERFKKTETIVILSDIYDTAIYESILKDTWKVTPYRIIKRSEFNPLEFMTENYSFMILEYNQKLNKFQTEVIGVTPGIFLFMFKMDEKTKELEKFNKKSEKSKAEYNLMARHRIPMQNIILHPNETLINLMLGQEYVVQNVENAMFETESFHTYKPGLIKNYLQNINDDFLEGKFRVSVFDEVCLQDIKKLKKMTLYIPKYITLEYQPWSGTEKQMADKDAAGLFKDYKYQYEMLSTDQISDKILSGEDFYYVRYTRFATQKFIDVVNSKSGEIIYSKSYMGVTNYQIESSYFKDLKKAVDTGKI